MPATRSGHCSVAIGSQLIIIGGYKSSSCYSSSVMSYDTTNKDVSWQGLAPLSQARWAHACETGEFENQHGIFVTGGYYDDYLNSVEFHLWGSNTWQILGSMITARY